jgi:glutamine synthetase
MMKNINRLVKPNFIQQAHKMQFHYKNLDQRGKSTVEYVWIGGTGQDLRSKLKIVKGKIEDLSQCSNWNYDGSSTGQAPTANSEVVIKPVALFNDPFRGGDNKMVFCDTYHVNGNPTNTNFRHFAQKIFDKDSNKEHDPHFGLEQEYVMMKPTGTGMRWPLGFPDGGYPKPQFQYYCGNGANNAFGRNLSDDHLKVCMYAGLDIEGTNAEVMPGQWEYQIGTSAGIRAADHHWMSRFLLQRVGEIYGVIISIDPKPMHGDWNGSGNHCNFSTKKTMADGGMKVILEHMKNLEKHHLDSIALYGEDNQQRLTGHHETSSMHKFSFGVANRGASVRIPRSTEKSGKGFYEDRRPAANIDPYVVTSSLFSIAALNSYGLPELVQHYKNFRDGKQNH